MQVSIDTSGTYAVARLEGALGQEDLDSLMTELLPLVDQPKSQLIVDLSRVDTIDSSGLNVLINLVIRSRLHEGRVILVGPNKFVSGVLELTQLDRWFEICSTADEAVQQLA